jgi:hypothetical protein
MARPWTYMDLIVSANKSGTRTNYKREWPHGYKLAVKFGLLDSLFPETANRLDKAITLAIELNNPAEFRKRYPAAARMLHRNGYRNDGTKNSC